MVCPASERLKAARGWWLSQNPFQKVIRFSPENEKVLTEVLGWHLSGCPGHLGSSMSENWYEDGFDSCSWPRDQGGRPLCRNGAGVLGWCLPMVQVVSYTGEKKHVPILTAVIRGARPANGPCCGSFWRCFRFGVKKTKSS